VLVVGPTESKDELPAKDYNGILDDVIELMTDLKLLPIDLKKYPLEEWDQIRVADLMRILPKDGKTVLDVGALWGYCSELLTQYFESVTALDLDQPTWEFPGVVTVQGDITQLQFGDNSFDCVFCAEVLEHITQLEKAASELVRVARKYVVIGVPFEQDLRVSRLTCPNCGRTTPRYGHVNSFSEDKLKRLFGTLTPVTVSFILPQKQARTNALSAWLMDLAQNPDGPYDQLEPCCHCGGRLRPPLNRSPIERGCSFVARGINRLQSRFTPPKPGWMHVVFRKGQDA
jgi:ubiquinone/menaquinone biosynthesis C-methylase UbiE